ncbi:exported hypothetical protein [Candidatus Sulfotelmatobacter kueseliae]|uniref:IPT/TIG domain-containing protein n=1 Tax=Candidatus Sulfotelmatobacter kueseliae TaxID=2042962 RepID=A0A2U3L760_9BACT|nr:exported hypothetical protein [Candidatus Sulfotelmatobacter kueseliae]
MATRMLNLLKMLNWGSLLPTALACALLVALAAAPLHAQFTYADVFDMNCDTDLTGNGACDAFNIGSLSLWTDGNLYGTAYEEEAPYCTLIFNVSTSGTYTHVLTFTGSTGKVKGCREYAGLTPAGTKTVTFYGATSSGVLGAGTPGEIFHFDPATNTFKVLHTFAGVDSEYLAQPVVGKDGNLYGATSSTGATYQINSTTGAFTQLPNSAPGGVQGPLYLASDGNLYGTAPYGGALGSGIVFSLNTGTGDIKKVYPFNYKTDGSYPNSPLTQGADGYLYGTAQDGGPAGLGSVFKVSTAGTFKTVYSFAGAPDGESPVAGLLAASDGNFYGTTASGGLYGYGTIFRISATGAYKKLFDFTGKSGAVPGSDPTTTLMQHPNGSFYGLTMEGGLNNDNKGVVYRLTPVKLSVVLCCNTFVILDQPVNIFGVNLDQIVSVTFAGVQARFQQVSPNYLQAFVPSDAADGRVVVTAVNSAGGEEQLQSQQKLHILPIITNLDPGSGSVGSRVGIVGGGFAGATKVTFGGVATGNFTVVSPALIQATVPAGAVTGKVRVVTHNGSALSKETFTVN